MRYLVVLLTCCLTCTTAWGQAHPGVKRTWNWYFGYQAGVNFSSGYAIADTNGAMHASEGCASISDTTGDLLFYTNGVTVWDASHDTMPNGNGLSGHNSSSQGTIIVPAPCNGKRYYIFTNGVYPSFSEGLQYSIVNLELNSGSGDIEDTQKNISLLPYSSEKLTAVKHQNNKDIWVITHQVNNNSYYAYLISGAGINTPVVSNTGIKLDSEGGAAGQMKVSPDGSMIAMSIRHTDAPYDLIQIAKFDNKTGIISNTVRVRGVDSSYTIGGLEFSPNSNYLYVDERKYSNLLKIYQYELNIYDSINIQNSRTVVGTIGDSTALSMQIQNGSLQLSPDNKIFHTTYDAILPDADSIAYYLNVINDPNTLGMGCDFVKKSLYLDGQKTRHGLPNFIVSYFNKKDTVSPKKPSASFSYLISDSMVYFMDSSVNAVSWLWDFGDGKNSTLQNPSHIYTDTGTYSVRLYAYNGCYWDTSYTYVNYTYNITSGNQNRCSDLKAYIYPNPSDNLINIKLNCCTKDAAVKLYNMNGELVLEKEFYNEYIKISTYGLQSGVYSLNIQQDDKFLNKKIIIK